MTGQTEPTGKEVSVEEKLAALEEFMAGFAYSMFAVDAAMYRGFLRGIRRALAEEKADG